MAEKARYWTCVAYPENMLEDWENKIADLLQFPYCYCIHDKDITSKDEEKRKKHVHIVLCFSNTTTYKNAFNVFSTLNAENKIALNKIERVHNIRYIYDYLIHDTDSCRKSNKYIYDISERICGNNFDIGNFEQIALSEKRDYLKELCNLIYEKEIYNFLDLYMVVSNDFESVYTDVLLANSGTLERLCKGMFLKLKMKGYFTNE